MARGFYSVIQYCPDRFRAESVNVGLVLLCQEPLEVRVRIIEKLKRVKSLFGGDRSSLNNLSLSIEGLKSRIESAAGDLKTFEDLSSFAASRANDLRLTEPRLAKLVNIDDDLERLFAQLVDVRSTAIQAAQFPAEVLPPSLSEVFYRLQQENKIWKPGMITVPVYKRKLDIPYAFRNGVVNLIKPHVFPSSKRAETQAAEFAINGDLIQKHKIDGEQQKLVVISTQETVEQASEVDEHVEPLFREYGVRLIRPRDADAFAREVELSAH